MNSKIKLQKQGYLELIIGCMFAGKTDEFIRKIKRLKYAGYKCKIFKPLIDNRYSNQKIISHDHFSLRATNIGRSDDIVTLVDSSIDVVGIDEIQFFDNKIAGVVDTLVKRNKIVICAGLDKDFRGEPFHHVWKTAWHAESIIKLHAICVICGGTADRTQRIINGQYATMNDPIIVVGSSDKYEARCRFHHVIEYQQLKEAS